MSHSSPRQHERSHPACWWDRRHWLSRRGLLSSVENYLRRNEGAPQDLWFVYLGPPIRCIFAEIGRSGDGFQCILQLLVREVQVVCGRDISRINLTNAGLYICAERPIRVWGLVVNSIWQPSCRLTDVRSALPLQKRFIVVGERGDGRPILPGVRTAKERS